MTSLMYRRPSIDRVVLIHRDESFQSLVDFLAYQNVFRVRLWIDGDRLRLLFSCCAVYGYPHAPPLPGWPTRAPTIPDA